VFAASRQYDSARLEVIPAETTVKRLSAPKIASASRVTTLGFLTFTQRASG
jgi:hypothetical protein